jgi:hypothetical protein
MPDLNQEVPAKGTDIPQPDPEIGPGFELGPDGTAGAPRSTSVGPHGMNRIQVDLPTAPRWLRIFAPGFSPTKPIWADVVVLVLVAVVVSVGARLAFDAPAVIEGPTISLSRGALPFYAVRSLARMSAADALSFLFSMIYGYVAARRRRAERVLMPLLDVLQSVPILSFLPVVLLSFSAILPQRLAAELASIVLIFTSQAWNLTFAWYQSSSRFPRNCRRRAPPSA